MSDLQLLVAVVWVLVMGLIWGVAVPVAFEFHEFESPENKRHAARTILLAPIWPLALIYLLLRYVPPAIGRVFYIGLGPKEGGDE